MLRRLLQAEDQNSPFGFRQRSYACAMLAKLCSDFAESFAYSLDFYIRFSTSGCFKKHIRHGHILYKLRITGECLQQSWKKVMSYLV